MPAERLHLVRHGEVHNPQHVLYERIPGYGLSEAGRGMAHAAAEHISTLERPVTRLVCSPLQRAQESAEPFAEIFDLTPVIDEGVIEPWNAFAGKRMKKAVLNPLNWRLLVNPSKPSWGEPFASISQRVVTAMHAAWDAADGGDVVIVSHQAPIWIAHLAVAGETLAHSPTKRRCALSSVTSFERPGTGPTGFAEVAYAEPAAAGIDLGAV
ncbi:histidine phosphatase family protein [Microbacterium amylolyticum]|uniref:Broad specificity phosphatase PhoE n=1 Tax=Microbacterium amylolyticum TaxID=936337 RepID=A0ABS4ZK00_9MICO|nr:histidine phosphatase family protein [Microbacterium amylolyticum]MBP2437333.1 broad specificity phosphatase PhoE [Microbacterium amylolyticum]